MFYPCKACSIQAEILLVSGWLNFNLQATYLPSRIIMVANTSAMYSTTVYIHCVPKKHVTTFSTITLTISVRVQ